VPSQISAGERIFYNKFSFKEILVNSLSSVDDLIGKPQPLGHGDTENKSSVTLCLRGEISRPTLKRETIEILRNS